MERTVAAAGRRPILVRRGGDADDPEPFDAFVELWGRLLSEVDGERTVLVVEGERDRRSVRRLGWAGPVAIVHRGRPLSATASSLAGRTVIVLTDWDAEGGRLARRLADFLATDGGRLDLEYRRRLARVLRGELTHLEGLFGWARRQAERRGDSIERITEGADGPTG